MKIFKDCFKLGNNTVTLETGFMARKASGSVTVKIGKAVLLVTTTINQEIKEGIDFLPLTVSYKEKAYASGKIPGNFLRREGHSNDYEKLIARLIDRTLRPLFPKNFYHEIQILATVLSFDPEIQPDIPALIGASASLMLSGVPFDGPIAGVRVGFIDGKYIINPSFLKQESSELDLVISGTSEAILMVESEANNLPEEVMLGALLYGHKEIKVIIKYLNNLQKIATNFNYIPHNQQSFYELKEKIKSKFIKEIKIAFQTQNKQQRIQLINNLNTMIIESFSEEKLSVINAKKIYLEIEKDIMRQNLLDGKPRIDGRDTRSIRPINIQIGVLPQAHGSALFTRGETQALVVTTLGHDKDAQILESLTGKKKNRYMLHYNFPSFSVGETGMIGGFPKRREIGHGNLAKRAIKAVLPYEEYPYVIRVVSEILESNGSSSMASVCGASLSMMDAGVPLAGPVAGIAMGLVKQGNKYSILSDILGEEDHLGDMDFKVAGTRNGITALQMDIKIKGIQVDIIHEILKQAKEGRIHILNMMNEVISEYKKNPSDNIPIIKTIMINPNHIRDIIGKGGITIKKMTEKHAVEIDTSDNGAIKIFAKNKHDLKNVISEIESLTEKAEIGKNYSGTIVKVIDFGVFVNILPGKDGLLPFNELENFGISPNSMIEGKKLLVMVQNIDRLGKIRLIPIINKEKK